jgi:hypothetical protein
VHNSPQTSSVGVLGDLSFLKMFLMDAFFIILALEGFVVESRYVR